MRWRVLSTAWGVLVVLAPSLPAQAPGRAPPAQSTQRRLADLEARVAQLEEEAAEAAERAAEEERGDGASRDIVEANYSRGILSLGGLRFRLGGQAKIDFVDPQSERDPLLGGTDSPDPHLEVDRFRLTPRVDFPRSDALGDVSLRGQFDFHPAQGDTILKEITLNHAVAPRWWIASNLKLGLDDRFIRPGRLTQNYPLTGTAFWRDESVAVFWEGTLGDRRGRPEEKAAGKASKKASKKSSKKSEKKAPRRPRAAGAPAGVTDDGEPVRGDSDGADGADGEAVPSRTSRARSTEHSPFDFASNPGALKLHLSAGDGHGLNGKEIGKDNAVFNELLQDDRDLGPPLTLREIGLGAGYERDFRELGELEVLAFYYDDELSDESASFLRDELTERDPITLAAIRGYGDSDSRRRTRMGFNVGYHFEAFHLFEAMGALDRLNPRRGDGLYLFYQWIAAEDGELDRDGWYAQASYRFSNPARWRYLRTFEPVVRYGVLDVDLPRIPSLPLTWSRKQLLVGTIVELVRDVYLRAEYTFNDESSGAGGVSNNELLIQLLAQF